MNDSDIYDMRLALMERLANLGSCILPHVEYKFTPMVDGGMGSYKIFADDWESGRVFGSESGSIQFRDTDGVTVIATLYVDKNGLPLEVDVWKTDFNKLIQFPDYRVRG